MPRILVLNGPNMQLLGVREPGIYGTNTLADLEAHLIKYAKERGIYLECRQSNCENELMQWINLAKSQNFTGIVFNPAAYTHTSIALHDCIKAASIPVIEVHISDISSRESFRAQSILLPACRGQFCGFGFTSYTLAIDYLLSL